MWVARTQRHPRITAGGRWLQYYTRLQVYVDSSRLGSPVYIQRIILSALN